MCFPHKDAVPETASAYARTSPATFVQIFVTIKLWNTLPDGNIALENCCLRDGISFLGSNLFWPGAKKTCYFQGGEKKHENMSNSGIGLHLPPLYYIDLA